MATFSSFQPYEYYWGQIFDPRSGPINEVAKIPPIPITYLNMHKFRVQNLAILHIDKLVHTKFSDFMNLWIYVIK